MENNPYEALAALLPSGGATPVFRRGRVVSVDPLKVDVAGTQQSGNIYANPALLKGAKTSAKVEGSVYIASGEGVSGAVTGTVTLTAEKAALAAGDEVLLLSEADQVFILVCRLVRA